MCVCVSGWRFEGPGILLLFSQSGEDPLLDRRSPNIPRVYMNS